MAISLAFVLLYKWGVYLHLFISLDETLDEEMRDIVEKSARHLYGLIHARFIITTHGLTKMVRRFDFRIARIDRTTWTTTLLATYLTSFFFFFFFDLLFMKFVIKSWKNSKSAILDGAHEFSATATLFCLWHSQISPTPNPSSYSAAAAKTFTTQSRLAMHRSMVPISDAVSPICSSRSTLNWFPQRARIAMFLGSSASNSMMWRSNTDTRIWCGRRVTPGSWPESKACLPDPLPQHPRQPRSSNIKPRSRAARPLHLNLEPWLISTKISCKPARKTSFQNVFQ